MSETLPFSGMAIYFPADGDYQGAKRSENGKQVDPEHVRVDAYIPYNFQSKSNGGVVFETLTVSRSMDYGVKDLVDKKAEPSEKEKKARMGYVGQIGFRSFCISDLQNMAILFGPVEHQTSEQNQEENPEKKSSEETENYINRLQEMIVVPYSFAPNQDDPDSLEIEAALLEISDNGTIYGTLGSIACRFDERGNVSGEIIPRKPRKKTSGSVGKPQIA